MKNIKLKIIGGIVAIIIAALITITFMLDGMIKAGIENTTSELLKTDVSVGNVDISIFSGSGSISGFIVQNPENYSDELALRIDEVQIKLDLRSLLSDQITVNSIYVEGPSLYFEQKGFGANLKTLIDNMNSASNEESNTKLIIEHLVVENGSVKVSTDIDRKRTAKTSLKKMELHDIGKQEGYSIRETSRELMRPLLEQAISEALKSGVTEQVKNKVNELFGS